MVIRLTASTGGISLNYYRKVIVSCEQCSQWNHFSRTSAKYKTKTNKVLHSTPSLMNSFRRKRNQPQMKMKCKRVSKEIVTLQINQNKHQQCNFNSNVYMVELIRDGNKILNNRSVEVWEQHPIIFPVVGRVLNLNMTVTISRLTTNRNITSNPVAGKIK